MAKTKLPSVHYGEEKAEISIHECRIFLALDTDSWKTATQISKISKTARRTSSYHLLRFCKLGIADLAEVFPAHRYRLSIKAHRRNHAYLTRITQALEVFGLSKK